MRTHPKLSSVDFAQLEPTRDYLQDVAKVLGKLQQSFIKPSVYEWHRGLKVIHGCLETQALHGIKHISLDIRSGILRADQTEWKLQKYSAQGIMNDLQQWLMNHGREEVIALPELITNAPHFDAQQATLIADILTWSNNLFQDLKRNIIGKTSPILLYPHHFDVSLVYFLGSDSSQLSFGLSLGDQYIHEPYFYCTEYPQTHQLLSKPFATPAFIQTDGFDGAILRYNDIVSQNDPEYILRSYFMTALER